MGRLYWTGFGFQANIVEEYLLLAAMLHIMVALRRTWDMNKAGTLESGRLNLAITGVLLLFYMMVHLTQYRFAATEPYYLRPPPYGVTFQDLPHLVTTTDTSVPLVPVRDIYRLEHELFQKPEWCFYYILCTTIFLAHYMWGWEKAVPASALRIPKAHHVKVKYLGWAIGWFVAICYWSFPVYCYFWPMKVGAQGKS